MQCFTAYVMDFGDKSKLYKMLMLASNHSVITVDYIVNIMLTVHCRCFKNDESD